MNNVSAEQLLAEPIIELSKTYVSKLGVRLTDYVNSIFTLTYYGDCFGCSFCGDECCTEGCFVEPEILHKINIEAKELVAFTGVESDEWFLEEKQFAKEICEIEFTQTAVKDGQCVFANMTSSNSHTKGCGLHTYALSKGMDYHDIKPYHCALFPLLVWEEVLQPNLHLDPYQNLKCLVPGKSLYRGVRDELLYYYGAELVAELDAIEATIPVISPQEDSGLVTIAGNQ